MTTETQPSQPDSKSTAPLVVYREDGLCLIDIATAASWIGHSTKWIYRRAEVRPEILVRDFALARTTLVDVEELAQHVSDHNVALAVHWPDHNRGQEGSGDFAGLEPFSSVVLAATDHRATPLRARRFGDWFRSHFLREITGSISGQREVTPSPFVFLLPCEAAAVLDLLDGLAIEIEIAASERPGGETMALLALRDLRSWSPRLRKIIEVAAQ